MGTLRPLALRERHGLLVAVIDELGFVPVERFDRYVSGVSLAPDGWEVAAGGDWPDEFPRIEDGEGHAAPVRLTFVESWIGTPPALVAYGYQLRVGDQVHRFDRDPDKRDPNLLYHEHPFGSAPDVREPMHEIHPERAADQLLATYVMRSDTEPSAG